MNKELPPFLSVLIVDQNQEHKGVLTNAAFVLGLSAGRILPEDTFGGVAVDGDGQKHHPLTRIPHFVRKANQSKIRTLRDIFLKKEKIVVVDYTEDAAPSDYETYTQQLLLHSGDQILYRALYVYGPSETVYLLTKNLSSLQ
jgi:Protein of unknown function (DUF2000)